MVKVGALVRGLLLLALAAMLLVAVQWLGMRAWNGYLGSALLSAEWQIPPGGPPPTILADEPAHPHWRW